MSTIHETPSGRIIATGYALTDLECQNEGVHKAPSQVGIEIRREDLVWLLAKLLAETITRT